jgi:uncharacterized protein YciI
MKKYLLSLFVVMSLAAESQENKAKYDKALAEQLGADDYGMKNYIFVVLKTEPKDSIITDKEIRGTLFKGHMANITRLAKEGKLVVAGPFGENDKTYRGLFILNVKTKEEALALLETDPTIREKIFEVDLFPWYGSAAISEHLNVHERIAKKNP